MSLWDTGTSCNFIDLDNGHYTISSSEDNDLSTSFYCFDGYVFDSSHPEENFDLICRNNMWTHDGEHAFTLPKCIRNYIKLITVFFVFAQLKSVHSLTWRNVY